MQSRDRLAHPRPHYKLGRRCRRLHAEEEHEVDDARRHADAIIARRPNCRARQTYGHTYQITLPEDSFLD